MARSQFKAGTINYSGRAFHQDATEAMRGDIVRGLIELITNSDDSYASMEGLKAGKISVEVEHRRNQPWAVVVRDRATGMSADTMMQRLASLGERTSGFETGGDRRGNLGRGAKDLAAFGKVTFESVCEGEYAKFVLHPDGRYDAIESRKAKEEDRERLGIPRACGTVVTVEAAAGIRCPQHENLFRRLVTHFQLRDILSDPTRHVELKNLNDGDSRHLVYVYPRADEVYKGTIAVPGYDGIMAKLTIWRLAERCEDGPEATGRPAGILIKGKRAIYENTLCKYEGDIHSGWFAGKMECQHIDRLAREYDDNLGKDAPLDPANPMPIISRRRDGLNANHPFVQALKKATEGPLGNLIADEAERARDAARTVESADTREALDRLARELGRLVTEELREIDAEDLPGEEGGEAPLLSVVPEEVFAYMGEDRTLTVAARKAGVAVGDEVQVEVDPGGVVELLTPIAPLRAHARREDLLVAQVRVRPLIVGEATMLTARLAGRSAHALIEVRPSREVVEEPITPPDGLQFERPSYRIGWQRRKELLILAPVELVAEVGEDLKVSSTEPGLVVRTPTVQLKYQDDLDFYRGTVVVEGRMLDAAGQVVARKGDIVATTQCKVTRKEEGPGFRIELCEEQMAPFRAIIEPNQDGVQVVKVAARHPGLLPYLGESFEGQNTPVVRALIAEAVADAGARLVVSKLYRQRRNTENFDVDRFYREHYKVLEKFIPRFQRVLLGDPAAVLADAMVTPVVSLDRASAEATAAQDELR
jgi:hypothetical protein